MSQPPETTDSAQERNLSEVAAKGVRWTGVGQGFTSVLQMAQLAILARFLEPADFGLFAMVTAVLLFFQSVADLGFSAAIIQRASLKAEEISTLFWLGLLANAGFLLLAAALTPGLVWFYDEPQVGPLYLWALLILPLAALGQVFTALLQRHMKFRALGVVQILAGILGFAVTVVLAWKGFGVMSMIWGMMCGALARSLGNLMAAWSLWTPGFSFQVKQVKPMLSFGLFQMGERLLNAVHSNIDKILLGKCLGADALGYYFAATQIARKPHTTLAPPVTSTVFPLFSRIQDDIPRLRGAFCKVIHYLSMLNFPIYLGLVATAGFVIEVAYGPQWAPAAVILQVLCLLSALRVLGNPTGVLLLSQGRASWTFGLNVMAAVVNLVAVWIGAQRGALEVAVALLAAMVFINVPVGFWVRWKAVGLGGTAYLKAFAAPLGFALAMAGAVHHLPAILPDLGFPWPGVIQIAAGVVLYTGLMLLLQPKSSRQLLAFLRGKGELAA